MPHLFRFVGLSFLVPGVVSPELPRAIAVPAAYGDLGAAILALIATLALARRASWAIERWALRCSSRLRSCRRC
jgi:hypothetical protein